LEDFFKRECVTCNRDEDEVSLQKCAICFRFYCTDHGYTMSGREFCGQRCARYFFFPDEES
jgi:hypothetical protein